MTDKKQELLQITKDFRAKFNEWWIGGNIDPVTAEIWLSELGKVMVAARKEIQAKRKGEVWVSQKT